MFFNSMSTTKFKYCFSQAFINMFRIYVKMYNVVSYFPVEYSIVSILMCYELSINGEAFMKHWLLRERRTCSLEWDVAFTYIKKISRYTFLQTALKFIRLLKFDSYLEGSKAFKCTMLNSVQCLGISTYAHTS